MEPSLETYARVAAVLGADLTTRIYPNTGPSIHDRHAVPMTDLLLGSLHARWRPTPEVRVRYPSQGWIDIALYDPGARLVVATELESLLKRIEQLLRWSEAKAASLASADIWRSWNAAGTPEVGASSWSGGRDPTGRLRQLPGVCSRLPIRRTPAMPSPP